MTTWTRDEAVNVRDRLHDVNFFIARSRVRMHGGDYYRAWEDVGHAMAAKRAAIYECPVPESEAARGGVGFDDLYEIFEKKDLVMIAAAWNAVKVPHFGVPTQAEAARLLRSSADETEQFGRRHWPAPHPCAERWAAIVQTLRAHADALDANAQNLEPTQSAVRDAQEAFLHCLYPREPDETDPDMADVYWLFFWMDEGLLDAYCYLKAPQLFKGNESALVDKVLDAFEWTERRKADLLQAISEGFPDLPAPRSADWDPAPDPLPWPPKDHA